MKARPNTDAPLTRPKETSAMTIATAVAYWKNTAPAPQPAPRANTVAAHAPLTRTQIAGALSLIDQRALTIAAERGLALRVLSGFLWVTQNREDHIIGAGNRFVAAGSGPLVISALETTELRIEWPLREIERLSPGLELVEPGA
jgi:hypothetical protein